MNNWEDIYQQLKESNKQIYTYPELCKIFSEDKRTGYQKEKQINNWNRYILYEKKNKYFGRDTHGRMAYFDGEERNIGEFIKVKIHKTGGISLMGEIVK